LRRQRSVHGTWHSVPPPPGPLMRCKTLACRAPLQSSSTATTSTPIREHIAVLRKEWSTPGNQSRPGHLPPEAYRRKEAVDHTAITTKGSLGSTGRKPLTTRASSQPSEEPDWAAVSHSTGTSRREPVKYGFMALVKSIRGPVAVDGVLDGTIGAKLPSLLLLLRAGSQVTGMSAAEWV